MSQLQVCHTLRIFRYQVFKGTEKRGKGTMGWFYGDKSYISSPLVRKLTYKRVTLITGMKKNMKPKVPKVMKLWDRLMLRKRFIVETDFDQLKNIS
nr:transposase [Candidatus Enterovibrio escacola]